MDAERGLIKTDTLGARFKPAAKKQRGIVASVDREGGFAVGDEVRLQAPDKRPWSHLAEVLAR